MKRAAVPGGAPSDLRHPEPLAAAPLEAARQVEDDRQRIKIHRLLLTETLRRLRSGRTLERAHGVIHPEMTAIVRDALRLADLVFPGSKREPPDAPAEEGEAGPALSAGAAALAAAVARSSAAAVARRLVGVKAPGGVDVAMVRAWASGERKPLFSSRQAIAEALGIEADSWGPE